MIDRCSLVCKNREAITENRKESKVAKRDTLPAPSTLVARRVRSLREERQWTQAQLADRMNDLGEPLHQTAVAKIEAEDRRVTVDELFVLAAALDVSPVALLASDEKTVVRLARVDTSAPVLWSWVTMRAPLPFQDARAFAAAHAWARRLDEVERRKLLRAWVKRLTAFLEEHEGDVPPLVRGGIAAQLYNASRDLKQVGT
jgi:transcriptional regulator with XRE-family HTH domain